jgi:hypothetical protein
VINELSGKQAHPFRSPMDLMSMKQAVPMSSVKGGSLDQFDPNAVLQREQQGTQATRLSGSEQWICDALNVLVENIEGLPLLDALDEPSKTRGSK